MIESLSKARGGKFVDNSGKSLLAQQPRSQKTRREILKATKYLFQKHGFAGTRIADIVKRSGHSTGSFYHHFFNKEGLLKVLIEEYVHETSTLISQIDLSLEKHRSVYALFLFLSNETIKIFSDYRGLHMAIRELDHHEFHGRKRLERLTVLMGRRMKEVTQEYQELINADNPEEAIGHAIQLVIMVALRTQLNEGPIFPKDREKLSEMLANAACGILLVPPERK